MTAAADGWRLGPPDAAAASRVLLDEVHGGPLRARHPVVAFGSNAAPAQLMAKFGVVPTGIPVTRARLQGFALGYSAHVSVPGYIPWVLVDEPGGLVDCAVLWLDPEQQARLDATEPNYDLVRVDPVRYPLIVDGVVVPDGYSAYRGKWGALRWPGTDRPAPAGAQSSVFGALSGCGWFRDLLGSGGLVDCQRRLAADGDLRARVRHELAARGLVAPDGWAAG